MSIKPTNGRVVWFHPATGDVGGQPNAAMVTYVHAEIGRINLVVFDSDGMPYPARSVALWNGEGTPPARPYAEWMPYQLGQAAKTEAALAAGPGGAPPPTTSVQATSEQIAAFVATRPQVETSPSVVAPMARATESEAETPAPPSAS